MHGKTSHAFKRDNVITLTCRQVPTDYCRIGFRYVTRDFQRYQVPGTAFTFSQDSAKSFFYRLLGFKLQNVTDIFGKSSVAA